MIQQVREYLKVFGYVLSDHICKTLILYHIVCPAKYRQKIFTERVELSLQNICIEIGKRYEIHFMEIGSDEDHVHFLVQSVPVMSPSRVVQIYRKENIQTSSGGQEIALGR